MNNCQLEVGESHYMTESGLRRALEYEVLSIVGEGSTVKNLPAGLYCQLFLVDLRCGMLLSSHACDDAFGTKSGKQRDFRSGFVHEHGD